MKINYQQLEQHLAKKIGTIYLIHGNELLLVNEAIDAIRQASAQQGYTERTRIFGDTTTDWGKELHTNAHSLSLFATKRLLELDLRNAKIQSDNAKMLERYAKQPCPDTILLIYTQKLDAKAEKTAWYRAIEQTGIVVTVWPIAPEQLPQWISQRAKKANIPMTQASATWLAEQVEGNLLAAWQDIEKLGLLALTTSHHYTIEDVITDDSRFDIFDLVSSALIGNSTRSLRILNNLIAEDIEPVLILWALTRELRTLAEIMHQTQQGASLSGLFSQFRIWDKRQPGVRAFLKRHTQTSCWNLLLSAAKMDQIIKGVDVGNVPVELEQLVLNMAK